MKKMTKIAWLCSFLLLLSVLAAARFAFRPAEFRVLSSSMWPTFPGPHWSVSCTKCSHRFILSASAESPRPVASARFASCPKCGFSEIPIDPKSFKKGTPVRISRSDPPQPRRWDLTAFKMPDGRMAVKRVAGLPGEEIELRRGTLCVNGEPVEKPWDLWSRVLICLDREQEPGKILFVNKIPRPRLEGQPPTGELIPVPITNEPRWPSFNETAETGFVDDFFFPVLAFLFKKGSLIVNQGDRAWLIRHGAEECSLELRRLSLSENEPEQARSLSEADFDGAECHTCAFPADGCGLFLSCCDGFFTVSCENLILCRVPNPPVSERDLPVTCPLIVLTDEPDLFHREFRPGFHRDVGFGSAPPRRLGPDEYYVLGDNPALSVDSRASLPPVRRADMRGVLSEGNHLVHQ